MSAPDGHVELKGSRRGAPLGAKLLGPADPNESVFVTVVLRRRPDGPPVPDFDYYARTPLRQRRRLAQHEFAAKYGAAPADIEAVSSFATAACLTVTETSAVRRTVILSGTVAQMERAFGVTLGHYERPRRGAAHAQVAVTETYRGHDGVIYIPQHLGSVIIGVFGLDNRNITQQNGPGDPPIVSELTIPQVMTFYSWPTTSAAGQTIAIVSLGTYKDSGGNSHPNGYDPNTGSSSDFGQYFGTLGRSVPKIIIVPPAASSANGTPDSETTQDIAIAATVAQHATIAVYFLSYFSGGGFPDESGWIQLIGRVVHPATGDLPAGVPHPSVLSTSQLVSPGDDEYTMSLWGVTDAWIAAMSLAFQDAAAQGVTVCVSSGDQGSDSMIGSAQGNTEWGIPAGSNDNKAHVQYPASDPWVLSCGGTTIGRNTSGGPFVEYVYNDINSFRGFGFATGGGVSAWFTAAKGMVPPWQETANVPSSVNDGHIGRGVPDVAGNASSNSGYQIVVNGSPFFTGGTSATAPLYAGLIAVLNATLGENIGFLNPTLYALGSSVCRAVNGPPGPANNSLNGIQGYPATNPWNACTGWGVIDGNKLLSALQAEYQKSLTIILQDSTFGQDEVKENAGVFPQALFVTVAGLKPSDFPHGPIITLSPSSMQLSQWAPKFAPPVGPGGAATHIQITPTAIASDDPALGPQPQTFTFTYQLAFTDQGTAAFGLSGAYPQYLAIEASLPATSGTLTDFQQIELIKAADPRFSNGADWIASDDLRVFYVTEGSQMFGAPASIWSQANAPLEFIKWIIQNISGPNGTGPNGDSFENTLSPTNATLSQFPQTVGLTPQNVYNFAIARVRLTSTGSASPAKKVRVFFRLWQAMSADLAYSPPAVSASGSGGAIASPDTGPYRQWSDGTTYGVKVPLLGISPDGTEYITVPFFATGRVSPSAKMTTQPEDTPNARTITPPTGGGTQYAYFGCWLDTNQISPQFPLSPQGQMSPDGPFTAILPIQIIIQVGGHQCLIAEIVDDDAPIENGATPQDSDKLAQRNLAILPVSA